MRHPEPAERSLAERVILFPMPEIQIRPTIESDHAWVEQLSRDSWGSEIVIAHGEKLIPAELNGFIAETGGQKVGLITYQIKDNACEIVTLNSMKPNLGIGSALIRHTVEFAKQQGCSILHMITTNDNTNALRFYQKIGFRLSVLRPGVIAEYRKIKPEIPMTGEDDIPIRDEIELKMDL
jgi:GNAT superfamily N-acetyltransferase